MPKMKTNKAAAGVLKLPVPVKFCADSLAKDI